MLFYSWLLGGRRITVSGFRSSFGVHGSNRLLGGLGSFDGCPTAAICDRTGENRMKRVFGLVNCLIAAILVLSMVPGGPGNGFMAAQGPASAAPRISSRLDMQMKEKTRYIQNGGQTRPDEVLLPQLAGRSVQEASQQKVFLHSAARLSPSQLADLQSLGAAVYPDSWIPPVGNHPTGFVYAEAPVGRILDVAAKEYVSFVETAEVEIKAQNNQARLATGVNDVWNLGYNGAGVTVAVLDSGLDVTHGDIPTPTVLLDYSDYPILDYTVANTVTGHGTHVAGTGLGRGTLSGGTYRGVAPGASLVFLKIGKDSTGGASAAAIIGAVKAAVDTFGAKVINVSYGGWSQYHDGSDEASQAVDYAVSQGAVVVAAAGNEGADAQHYSGAVTGDSVTTDFIRVNVSGPVAANSTVLSFNLVWFDGLGGNNSLALDYYDSSFNLVSSSTNSSQSESTRGTEALLTRMTGYLPSVSSGSSGTWYLKVRNIYQVNQSFHLYYNDEYNATGAGLVSFQTPDPSYTISSPGEADSAIAVGAYVTRKYWTNYLGSTYSYGPSPGQTEGSIATFSSRGPRVDAGAPGKPNIVAPGSAIISARDGVAYPCPPRSSSYAPPYIDSNYYVMQGTSMAAPHAAGIAALLLSKNPSLTPAQVKTYLQTTATDKGAAGRDDTFGYGLVNALAAVNAVPAPPPTPTPSPSPTYVPTPTPTPVPASASPISYWKFSEGTGTIATDSMGRNQGSIDGAQWATGMVGNGLSFNGSSGYVSVADSPSLGFSGDGTIEMWVKPSGASGALIWKRVYAGSQGWTLYFASPNTLVGYINSNAANVSATNVPAGQWLHVALVYESGTMKLYLNGNLVSSVNVPQGFQASNAQLLVGRDVNGNYYSGLIDELAVFGKGLSHGEIWQHYLNGLAGSSYNMPAPTPTPPPTASPTPTVSPSPSPTPSPTPTPTPSPTRVPGSYWTRQFGADHAYGVAVDNSANIYVAGDTHGSLSGESNSGMADAYVIKYDSSGNLLWTRQFGSTADDSAFGVAADSSGNVYVAGKVRNALSGQTPPPPRYDDSFIRKYNSLGTELWTRQFGSNADDGASGVAVDGFGNAYVVGYTYGPLPGQSQSSAVDSYIRKYDTSGTEVWTRQFSTNSWFTASGVAVDSLGNVVLGGTGRLPLPPQSQPDSDDAFVSKYDRSGSALWTRQFGSGYNDQAFGVAVDSGGSVYVVGYAQGAIPGQTSSGGEDAFIRKYDSSGAEIWTRQFGTSRWDQFFAVCTVGSNDSYVVGYTSGTLPGQTSSDPPNIVLGDAFIRKYDGSGNAVWTRQFGSSGDDRARSVAVDGPGNVYVVGNADGALPGQTGGAGAFITKFSATGSEPPPYPAPTLTPSPTPTPSPTSSTTPIPTPVPTSTPTPTPSPLPASARPVSYWNFNEGTGTTVSDSVGGNPGTIYGASWTSGIAGNALSFNGANNYIFIPHSSSLEFSGDGTIEMWVKSNGATGILVWKRIYPGNQGWTLYFGFPNTLIGYVSSYATYVTADVPAGQWQHVAFVYEAGTTKLYVNGRLASSVVVPQGFKATTEPFYVGRDSYGNYYSGLIDELAVYGKGLSQGEIWQHYLNGLAGNSYNMPPPTPTPVPSPSPSPTPSPTPSPSPTPTPIAPVAGFPKSLSPGSGIAPCAVTFVDTSTNTPASWLWNFGDSTGSSLQNPVKTYNVGGNYTITLTATNAAGSSFASQTVSIYSVPVASFTDSASSGTAPLTINFTDTSIGNVGSWLWNFGDGTLSSTRNPSKTYSSYGSYVVTLTATNPAGSNSASAVKQVYSVPVPAFSASATGAEPGAMITFTDESTGNVTGWSWNFGDGTSSSSRNPGKTYVSSGNYSVALTAANPAGSTALTRTGYITIVSGALGLQSETSLVPGIDSGGYAVVHARINRIRKAANSETFAISDGLGAYDGYITHDPAGMTAVSVAGVTPFNSPTISLNAIGGTRTNINAMQTTSAPVPPMNVADVRLRLRGSKELPFTATMNFTTISRVGGSEAPQAGPAEFTFRRGDANGSGSVSITDALFIAQYLAGLRGLGTDAATVNAVNAASVRQDVTSPDVGDKITIADALYIAQMLAGLRDPYYG